jgi:hypothetical protein
MLHPAHQIAVNLGVKGLRNLPRRPGKDNQPVTRRNLLHRESMPFEPRRNPRSILRAHSEPLPILGRRQPLPVKRRMRIVLRRHQGVQLRLLRGRRLQHQHHPPQPGLRAYHPAVKLLPRQRMHVSRERHHPRLIDSPRDPARLHRPVRSRLPQPKRASRAQDQQPRAE